MFHLTFSNPGFHVFMHLRFENQCVKKASGRKKARTSEHNILLLTYSLPFFPGHLFTLVSTVYLLCVGTEGTHDIIKWGLEWIWLEDLFIYRIKTTTTFFLFLLLEWNPTPVTGIKKSLIRKLTRCAMCCIFLSVKFHLWLRLAAGISNGVGRDFQIVDARWGHKLLYNCATMWWSAHYYNK